MNYIAREKKKPEGLSETDRQFKEKIKGKTPAQAYRFFKRHQSVYQYNTAETKEVFARMNHKRCSFCTKWISEFNTEMTIEHIETKSSCPRKIFQWDNLLCSCRTCNTKRGRKEYKADAYLDPSSIKDIERYFCFHTDGTISVSKALSQAEADKAKYMIRLYRLDRDELNAERREFFNSLLDDELFEILKRRSRDAQDIHYLSVFTYYKRRTENGK